MTRARSVVDYIQCLGPAPLYVLIQIGGLGILTFISFHHGKSEKAQLKINRILRDSFSYGHNRTLGQFVRSILSRLLLSKDWVLLLMIRFIPKFGLRRIFNSIFLAVSAFCNAGFDNFGNDGLLGLQTRCFDRISPWLSSSLLEDWALWSGLTATKLGGENRRAALSY